MSDESKKKFEVSLIIFLFVEFPIAQMSTDFLGHLASYNNHWTTISF